MTDDGENAIENEKLTYRPLAKDTILKGFSCGEQELDQFFERKSLAAQGNGTIITTCVYRPGLANPVGFFSLASVAEPITKLQDYPYHTLKDCDHFPCLQLVYLAVHNRYQGNKIGSKMVGAVIERFIEIGTMIGLPHLILVPINDKIIPFYKDLGFYPYDGDNRMFLPLSTAVAELERAKEEAATLKKKAGALEQTGDAAPAERVKLGGGIF